jgi:hypothetical protein
MRLQSKETKLCLSLVKHQVIKAKFVGGWGVAPSLSGLHLYQDRIQWQTSFYEQDNEPSVAQMWNLLSI